MPTYVYRREDGTTFEIDQRISEPALEACPTTGQAVKRVITGGTGLIFKGSGFYLTDYVRNGKGKGKRAASPASNGETKSESKTESKSESKSDSKSESKSETKKSETKSETKAE